MMLMELFLVLLWQNFFDDIGFDYVIRIPNRFKDGYGLNVEIINELDVSLIITVDNGIAAVEAARVCKEKNIDLIITDHPYASRSFARCFCYY